MKKLVVFLIPILLWGQIPASYYQVAEGKSGDELKTALYNIIKGQTEYPYTASSTDVWDMLKETDRDPNNPDNVILLYSGRSVNAAQEYNSGSGWTREHVWAKSRGDFGTDMGPGTDAHHLRPVDNSVNSTRNNRWFDECDVPVYDDGVFTGSYKSATGWLWKPRVEVIGDVARMMFYMATRYEGENGEPDLELVDYIPADQNTKEPIHAKLSTLLAWNLQDPVDDFEQNRNNVIYRFQGNRNPFIDHPEYVARIWGGETTATEYVIPQDFEVGQAYPNPFNSRVTLPVTAENSTQIRVSLLSVTGRSLTTRNFTGSQDLSLDLSGQSSGVYFIRTSSGLQSSTQRIVLLK